MRVNVNSMRDAHFKNDQAVGEWNITRSEVKAKNAQGTLGLMNFETKVC
jgi:hypothetical protein